MEELNELKLILSPQAFGAYLGELLKAQMTASRPKPAPKKTSKSKSKK